MTPGHRRVLMVSPNFAPVNAADSHRVRTSLPYCADFGWQPFVLAVRPAFVEGVQDPLLGAQLPPHVSVTRVGALPVAWTRKVGLGNLGLRAFCQLGLAGLRLIRRHRIDLVYFSTTVFTSVTLGPLWKAATGVAFAVDFQDPWLTDYYEHVPPSRRPPKYKFDRALQRVLEPFAMRHASGIIAVSGDYINTLQQRYPRLRDVPVLTLPFGAPEQDFALLRAAPLPNRVFAANDGLIHGVYAGRGGSDMRFALRIIFEALQAGLNEAPDLFSRVRLHFVGTDYAIGAAARHTVLPVAEACGVAHAVEEIPRRLPYFEALQLLLDAQFLIIPGSDDPQYTASKIYPYILARKPLLAVFNDRSSVCDVIRTTDAGDVVAFVDGGPVQEYARQLTMIWTRVLRQLPRAPATRWETFERYTAREMTRRQCALFDRVLSSSRA